MQNENGNAQNVEDAALGSLRGHGENAEAHGVYNVQCHDADGVFKWEDVANNVVTYLGKNLAMDTYLAGSAYTVTGPYLGLINTNASSAVIGDTMSSHAAWLEVGNANAPAYTAPRKTVAWSASASGVKASTGTMTFAMTSAGTVGGCFLVLGTGAVSTIDNTSGTLYSAGAFTGGSKTVASGDSLTVTYTASL